MSEHVPFWLSVSKLPVEVRWEEVRGVSTRVLRFGDGRNPPIVLLHGTGGHAEAFMRNIASLAEQHYVVLYDLPGHGWSQTPNRPYVIGDYVDHLASLLDVLRIQETILCGLSLGGWISARFCATYGDRVSRLILVCPGGADADTSSMSGVRVKSMEIADNLTEEGVHQRLAMIMADVSHVSDELVSTRAAMYAVPDRAMRTEYALHLQDEEVRSREVLTLCELQRIHVPTLVLSGDSDAIVPPSKSRRIANSIAAAEYAEIRGAGHWPQFEAPAQFDKAVTDFLHRSHLTKGEEE